MTHRGPFQPLLFCDSVILSWAATELGTTSSRHHEPKMHFALNFEAMVTFLLDLGGQ